MEVLNNFVLDGTSYQVHVKMDDNNEPIFKAADVANILGIRNVSDTMAKYDDDEKVSF